MTDDCQQYPSHSVGDLVFGPDGYLYASMGEGASFLEPGAGGQDYGQYGGTLTDPNGNVDHAAQPVRRPDDGGRAPHRRRRRARAAPCAPRASGARTDPPSSTARSCACQTSGAGAPGNPFAASVTPTPSASWPTASATPSGSPSSPAAATYGSATSATTRGKRSTGSACPNGSGTANYGWPCVEGPDAGNYYIDDRVNLCSGITADTTVDPYCDYNHGCGRSGRRRRLQHQRRLGHQRRRPSTRERLPGRLPRRALLRRSLARLHLGHAARLERPARPGQRGHGPQRHGRGQLPAPARSTWRPGRTATCSTPTTTAGPSTRSATPRPRRSSRLTSPAASCRSRSHFDGTGSHGGASPLTYSWDLERRRHVRRQHERHPTGHLQHRWHVRRAAARDRREPGHQHERPSTPSPPATRPPPPRSTSSTAPRHRPNRPWTGTATRRPSGRAGSPPSTPSNQTITFGGSATDVGGRDVAGASALSWDVGIFHCPLAGCHTHDLQTFTGVAQRAVRRAAARLPVAPGDHPHGHQLAWPARRRPPSTSTPRRTS